MRLSVRKAPFSKTGRSWLRIRKCYGRKIEAGKLPSALLAAECVLV